jgi:protein-disulfide isomerase
MPPTLRTSLFVALCAAASLGGCTRAPSASNAACAPSSLPGVDTSELTAREQCEWARAVSELLAPCPEVAVSLSECVSARRACPACLPGAEFVLKQVRAGKPREQVVELFELRFDPGRVKTIVIGDSPALGPVDAPVTIVEFADFECPSCAGMHKLLRLLQGRFSGKLRLVYKHFPISYHPFADAAARASIAAQAQGKFWQLHPILFERQKELGDADLERYAAELGLDLERFRRDRDSATTKERVELDKRQGTGLGVHSTPTLFINGREVAPGTLDQPLDDLSSWIELELELAQRQPRPAGSAAEPAPPSAPPATALPMVTASSPAPSAAPAGRAP